MPDNQKKIRILLVEDNFLTRVGTTTLLSTQPDFEIAGEAEDGKAGLELYRQLKPDLAIVDLRMPGLDGVELATELAKEKPPARILVLTHYDGDENIFRALRAGALGYLTKEVRSAELFQAVRTVAGGERYLPAAIAGRLADRMLQPALSPRELQVLGEIFKGLSNKAIADALTLSEKTVIMYVSHILTKLDVKSRTEAVAVALQRGILRAD